MFYTRPVNDLVLERCSTRSYQDRPIALDLRRRLAEHLATLTCGPLGTPVRIELIAAVEGDREALRGLGTLGAVKGARGFMVGLARQGEKSLEDLGYALECAVLLATDLGLGTCWLGGFDRERFAAKAAARADEVLPVVAAAGYSASTDGTGRPLRKHARYGDRLPWQSLFCQERFGSPLAPESAGALAPCLDAVRHGPSSNNRQPWRIIRDGAAWHFYLQRTRGAQSSLLARLVHLADLQRVDMGIAMCHLSLAAAEHGLAGRWTVRDPGLALPDSLTEYTATWSSD